ncbi:MAG TPA: outer membrane beta-barrel protein [Candidatus Angelobacter sp.]|nr:outer membrane beta-barrel protein [Candidatus Angelobacter sp.]
MTALSSTTLSGYVDTSAQWNLGTGNANNPPYSFGGGDKADGFNLNVVQLSLDKPLDESEWAAGYHVDLWLGPDANALGTVSSATTSDFAIRQAYVALRTPIGNGIDWKIGVFDTIIGYESLSSPNNPNYTRSYGFSIEPTTHTGLLGTYKVSDMVNVSAGIANTVGPMINNRAFNGGGPFDGTEAESYKSYMGSVSLTAPTSWGWIGGSTLSAGAVNGFNVAAGANSANYYVGATMNTPINALKVGAAYDLLDVHHANGDAWDMAGYASYQLTEKLSVNARGEYLDQVNVAHVIEGTATLQYDLWKNVISRVEFRWDHGSNGRFFGGQFVDGVASAPTRRNAYLLAAQVIYKF